MRAAILALLALLLATPTWADADIKVKDLYAICSNKDDNTWCLAYTTGLIEGLSLE